MFRGQLADALGSLDQPTVDGLNTYFVSRAVREAGLTVALAGTGGDELFGGYPSFRDVPWAAAGAVGLPRCRRICCVARQYCHPCPGDVRRSVAADALGKLGDALASRGSLVDTYQVSYALFASDFARELLTRSVNGDFHVGLPGEVARELGELVDSRRPWPAVSTLELWCFLGERLLRDTDA